MIERNNGYKKGEDGETSREYFSDEKCSSSKKKAHTRTKKRERRERCPRLRVETFTREEEMRI